MGGLSLILTLTPTLTSGDGRHRRVGGRRCPAPGLQEEAAALIVERGQLPPLPTNTDAQRVRQGVRSCPARRTVLSSIFANMFAQVVHPPLRHRPHVQRAKSHTHLRPNPAAAVLASLSSSFSPVESSDAHLATCSGMLVFCLLWRPDRTHISIYMMRLGYRNRFSSGQGSPATGGRCGSGVTI